MMSVGSNWGPKTRDASSKEGRSRKASCLTVAFRGVRSFDTTNNIGVVSHHRLPDTIIDERVAGLNLVTGQTASLTLGIGATGSSAVNITDHMCNGVVNRGGGDLSGTDNQICRKLVINEILREYSGEIIQSENGCIGC
jgi:hypothetical protein